MDLTPEPPDITPSWTARPKGTTDADANINQEKRACTDDEHTDPSANEPVW